MLVTPGNPYIFGSRQVELGFFLCLSSTLPNVFVKSIHPETKQGSFYSKRTTTRKTAKLQNRSTVNLE